MARTKKKTTEPKESPMFLLENSLETALKEVFPHVDDWVKNKNFRGCNFRPDYRSDSLKLCIEFDGYQHYTKAASVVNDRLKDDVYKGAGYKVVRIPYFVQLSQKTLKVLFDVKTAWKQIYPHGFVSKEPTVKLPADFCELGLKKFLEDLKTFSCIKKDILESLKLREEPIDQVLPPSLQHLLAEV